MSPVSATELVRRNEVLEDRKKHIVALCRSFWGEVDARLTAFSQEAREAGLRVTYESDDAPEAATATLAANGQVFKLILRWDAAYEPLRAERHPVALSKKPLGGRLLIYDHGNEAKPLLIVAIYQDCDGMRRCEGWIESPDDGGKTWGLLSEDLLEGTGAKAAEMLLAFAYMSDAWWRPSLALSQVRKGGDGVRSRRLVLPTPNA